MRQILLSSIIVPFFIAPAFAQTARSPVKVNDIVELELLTHTKLRTRFPKKGKRRCS